MDRERRDDARGRAMLDLGRALIEEYDLDHGNAECLIQGDELYMTVEAPNNATIGVDVPLDAGERGLRREIAYRMIEFDADDVFDEDWSSEFAEHNGFTPSRFLNMLQEDQRFFSDRARWLTHPEWGRPAEYGSVDDVICEIRWTDDDLRRWLDDHDYPSTTANMDAMRGMVDGDALRRQSIERGWEAIDMMVDPRRLSQDDTDATRESSAAIVCDPADPLAADTASTGLAR